MPIYKLNGDVYDIPQEKQGEFESQFPDAFISYTAGADQYDIPVSKREDFLKDFPDAQLYSIGTPQVQETPIEDPYATEDIPMFDDIPQTAPAEEKIAENSQKLRGFWANFKESSKGLWAGLKGYAGEQLNLFTGSSREEQAALNDLEELEAQGFDPVQYIADKEDAQFERMYGMSKADFLALDKRTRKDLVRQYNRSNAGIQYVSPDKLRQMEREQANQQAVQEAFQKALELAGGDYVKAKAILKEQAEDKTLGDALVEDASETLSNLRQSEGFAGWLGNLAPQMIPSATALALNWVTKGRAAGLSKWIGYGSMGGLTLSTSGMSMIEARNAGATNLEVWTTGIADGLIEIISEKIPFDRITGRVFSSAKAKLANGLADAVNSPKGRKELEELLVRANEKLGGKLLSKKNVGDWLLDTAYEAGGEFFAEALQTITPMIYENPEDYPTLAEVLANGWEGAKAGLVMGSVLGGASKGLEHSMNKERRQKQGFVDVAQIENKEGDVEVVEVVGLDPTTGKVSVLHDGELAQYDADKIGDTFRFSYEEFENARLKNLEDEAIDEGTVNNGQVEGMRETVAKDIEEIKTLDPSITDEGVEALRSGLIALEDGSPLAAAVKKLQEDSARLADLESAKAKEREAKKTAARQNIEKSVGQQFWMSEANNRDENGNVTYYEEVEEVVYADGRTGYVVGYDEAGNLSMVFTDGTKGFSSRAEIAEKMNSGEIVSDTPMGLDAYLESKIDQESAAAEQARMAEEYELNVQEMMATHPKDSIINLGTEEQKIEVPIIAPPTKDGVIVQMPDGSTPMLSWEDVAHAEKKEIKPRTDAQNEQSIVDQYKVAYTSPARTQEQAPIAERDAVVKETTPANPLPTKADGSVDQTALWNKDPERWAQWNDEQRQDGGANSLAYVSGAIAKEQAKIAELQAAYEAESDFDARDAIEKEIADTQARVERLTAIQQGYLTQTATPMPQNIESEPQTEEERRKPLRQKAQELSEKLGVKVNIAESISDVKEAKAREEILRIDISGSQERATGWFNPETGEVTIYLPHTTNTREIEKTIIHEVVAHKGLRGLLGEEGFNVLCDSVWNMMTEEERAKFLAYPGVNGNTRAAADEYIAHYAENVNLEESKPIWDRIMDLITRILNSIGVTLEITKEDLSDIIVASYQKLVADAKAEQGTKPSGTEGVASDNREGLGTSEGSSFRVTNSEEVNPAFVEAISTDVDEAEYAQFLDDKAFADPQPVDGIQPDDVRFSIVLEDKMRGNTQAYFDKHYNGGTLGKKDQKLVPLNVTHFTQVLLDAANAQIEEMRKYMLPYLDMESKGKRFLPAEVYGKSTLFDNSSYGKTMENTLICTRTLAYIDFVEEVKKRIGRPLTATESFLASQMLYDIAVDPQCLYCYVSLDRKAYDEFLLRYIQQRDEVISKWNASDKSAEAKDALYKEFLAGRKPTSQMQARFESWLLLSEGDNAITPADLATKARRGDLKISEAPEAWEKARNKYQRLKGDKKLAYAASEEYQTALWNYLASPLGQVTDAEAYAQSASWAKKEEDYRSYTGELLKCTADALKGLMGHYGLRFYSFSEYSPAFILENMQMVRDAAARGLKGFAYTKEIDFIKIFAPTGMNINCSVYGRVDSEGNVVPDIKQGADWAQVQALREQYPNVGAVFVATNDEMVEWALNQPWIDVIIPFHIVRTGADIAKFYEWTNYSSMQADTAPSGKTTYIFPHEHHNDKTTFLKIAQERGLSPRFADVKLADGRSIVEHPNYMRLVNETRRSVDETPILTPTFNVDAAKESFDAFVAKGGYYSGYFYEDEAFEQGIETVVEDIKAGKTAKDVDYGRQDVPIDVAKIMAKRAEMERKHGKSGVIDLVEEARKADLRHRVAAEGTLVPGHKKGQPMLSDAEMMADVSFRITKNTKATIETWFNKAGVDPEMTEATINYLDFAFEDTTEQLCAAKWYLNGKISLPDEDEYKVRDAVKVAKQNKVDALSYASPMDILNTFGQPKSKVKPINPDTIKEFSNKKELAEGIVVYDVQDDFEGQAAVRKIIDTHWGEDANPWCLAARVNGDLDRAKEMWQYYSKYPKRIAFRNGKLLAFYASANDKTWWDRNDEPHTNIPYSVKSKEGEYEVSTNYELKEGNKKAKKVSVGKSDKKGRTAYFVGNRLESAGIQDGERNLFYSSFPAGATLSDSTYGVGRSIEIQYGPYKNVTQITFERRTKGEPTYYMRVGYGQNGVRAISFVEGARSWDIRYGINGDQIFVGRAQLLFNLDGELDSMYSGAYSMQKINDEYYEFFRGGKAVGVVKKYEKVTMKMLEEFGEDGAPVGALLDFINDMGWDRADYPYPNPMDADLLRRDDEVREQIRKVENEINEIAGGRYLSSVPAIRFRITPEMKEIKKQAEKDGTFMKAPNGQPTNLTEEQWLMVRTKNFIKWFGDWLKPQRIEKLRNSEDASINGDEIAPAESLDKKAAFEYGKKLQGFYTNKDTGASIQLQRGRKNGGVNEVLQHNYKDAEHLQSIAAIPQIIEKSIFIESTPNADLEKNPDVVEYQHFVCGLKIGGEDYTVHSLVAVDKKGDRYYDHNLTAIEKKKLLDLIESQAVEGEDFGTTPGTQPTILSTYKGKQLVSLLQVDASKVVDANGEPKVVYHQTNQKIYVNRETGENWDDLGWKEKMEWDERDDWEDYWEEQDFNTFSRVNARTTNEFDGFFFAPEYDENHEYGDRTIAAFVNIKNPASREDYNIDSRYNDAGRNERIRLQEAGFDGVIRMDGDNVDEYIAFEPNQIKSATDNNGDFNPNNNDIRFRVTAEQDKAYMDAVKAGDLETAQKMVDAAARAAGYDSPKLYHGTRNFGFTKIDTSKSDDGLSFFITESPIIAQTYSGVKGERRINEAMGEADRKKLAEPYEEEANEYLLEHTRELAEWLNIEGRGIDIDEFATRVTDMFYDLEEWAIQEKKNSLDVLIHTIKTYDTILDEYYDKEKYASAEEQIKADDGTWDARLQVAKAIGKYVDVMNGEGSFGNYSFYANTWGMLEVECNGSNWNNIKSADLPYRSGRAWNTRAVAKYAKEEGWLGVVYKNLTDLGPRAVVAEWQRNTNIYNFFRPQQQVKSADPVTYDDNGNVIPLSERFNPENEDIRFRMRGENESAKEFTDSIVKDFKDDYNAVAPIEIVDLNSKKDVARFFNIPAEDITDDDIQFIKNDVEKKDIWAAYHPDLKKIVIFVRDSLTDSKKGELALIHENIHAINGKYPEFLALGEYLWNRVEEGTKEHKYKTAIQKFYPEHKWHDELSAYVVSEHMQNGTLDELRYILDLEHTNILNKILNTSGYGKERKSDRAGFFRNVLRKRSSGKVGRASEKKGGASELTAEERRIIGEYFPEFNKSEDVRMRVNSQGKELTEGQEEFFANSKAVDKDGNLLVLYHGTPRAGFTEFKSGWFTTSKEDAISYSGDRKGRLFDPDEKYEPETLTAGDFRLGYMTFDSEEDRAAFLERFPYADEVMSEREYEDARMGAEDEEYDALTARRKEFAEVWNAYREYERERFVDTTVGDLIANPEAYTEEDLMRAMLEYDSNATFDNLDDMSAEERMDALVSALQNANEETEGGILDMVVPTRVPRNGEGFKHNDLGNRTYEVYANVENPYEIDAKGRGSEFESGDIYKAVEEGLADERYDGVIVRNWRVGRTQQLGDVVVPKDGSQIKLTSNENPSESSDIQFRITEGGEESDIRFSIRTKPAPEHVETAYKLFNVDENGNPHALFIDGANALERGVWYDADSPLVKDLEKLEPGFTYLVDKDGNAIQKQYKNKQKSPSKAEVEEATANGSRYILVGQYANGKKSYHNWGINGSGQVSKFAMRPGWHLTDSPSARHIGEERNPEKKEEAMYRRPNQRWFKVEYAADVDYNEEAASNPTKDIQTHIPEDGYYSFKTNTNANDVNQNWIISGSIRILDPLSREEVTRLNSENGVPDDLDYREEPSFRTTGTPTDEVVANGLQLTPAQTAEVAANIFAALPEESRKKITEGLNGNILGLKDAILQIPTSLATKENWNEVDRAMADVVAEEMTKMAGEMTRPFSAEEGLWLLYNNLNKGTDLISQASRALVQRNLGFDAETLAKQEQAKEDVRFRTVGDASSNAEASLYNRGAANVWTRLKESYVDMMASVEELVKAIEKRTGKVAQGFENILLALNQQSSKGLAAMESYEQRFLKPMFDEIRRIMDETKMKYEDVVRYVILKHGLERNKKLAQRDARAHYQEIYDDIISKINSMDDRQKRTYLTNAQLKEADAKANLSTLQAVDTSLMTDEEKKEHKKQLAIARKAVAEAEEYLKRAEKIRSMSEQEAKDELDKIFEKIENGTDSVFKEMRENDYSGISSMFYDQLGVDRKKFSTEEQYQAALMEAKKDRYSSLKDIEAAAEAEVKSFEGRTDTKELWKRINAATKETLRQQYEANMISKDQYLNLRDMFEYYVPLRGFKDNTAEDMYTYYRKPNSTGYTKPILGAEGRKTEAESPFGWIAAMAGSAIASNVKNEAKLALYYFVSNRPENGIATISKTWFVDSGEVDERGKKIFKPAYPPFSEDLSSAEGKAQYEIWQANMKELQKKGQAYEAGQRLNLGNAVVNISDANKPEHIVNVKVGGKDYTIIINGNPRAAQAINGDLNIEGTAQDYSALFGPVLRWMSSVNTSYNPEFWITNMMRDMAFTMMAVNIKEDPAYRRKFKKNYRKAFKVISLVAKNEKGTIGDSYLEQQYKDFVKYGGVTGYTQIKDSETWEHEIENYLSSSDPESLKSGKVMRGMKTAFHVAHRFGESLEQVSRFAAFLTARETGKSINEAIDDAKEITVNFNRKGSGKMITLEEAKYLTGKNGQPLTKPQQWMVVGLSSIAPLGRRFIMFFNAAIQGLNATYKLMKKNPKRFTGWALGYAAVGMMNAVLHAMLDDDDDYLDIPQYERRNSLMIGGNGAYFKWALPQEARAFYALGDLAVETVMGRNPHQNFLGEALKIGTEILPVNPSEGWKAFMPSVAIPFIELALNEDYKGAPIYNEQKWLSEEEKERTAKWSNAYQGTGWTYVKIAQGLNFITGGDKHDAGWINLHPEKLEHLVQSAFGGTIRTADKFINTISAAIDPEEPNTVRQAPFLNRFLTINDERFKNVHVNDVFDYYKADAEHALTLEKQYTKDRDKESLTELRSSDEYRWAKIYGKYKKPLKSIQDKIKVADGTAEKKELMKQQDELKKRMIKEISEL